MSDIGPDPLICIQTVRCNCGAGVDEGRLYQCTELVPAPFIYAIFNSCACGQDHLYVALAGNDHIYCPYAFSPLGDPDAVIKETDEPSDAKRREDDCYDLPRVKETEYV